MKRNSALVILAALVLVSFASSIAVFQHYMNVGTETLAMNILVDDVVGFNLDTNALWFGMAAPGSLASRNVTVTNSNPVPVTVRISTSGGLSEWVTISDNGFPLDSGESKNITFYALIPLDALPGSYNGTVTVLYMRGLL